MLQLRTAQNFTISLNWIGVSDFDGSLRFETPETDLAVLFSAFSDPAHTKTLTRIFDEDEKTFSGFTAFKGLEKMANGCTVVRLMPEKNV